MTSQLCIVRNWIAIGYIYNRLKILRILIENAYPTIVDYDSIDLTIKLIIKFV